MFAKSTIEGEMIQSRVTQLGTARVRRWPGRERGEFDGRFFFYQINVQELEEYVTLHSWYPVASGALLNL